MNRNLEDELFQNESIREKVQNETYAQRLYAALCNIQWYVDKPEDNWTCSWRYAGELVAALRNQNEDYLDFYCSGMGKNTTPEGIVNQEIENDLASMGWKWREWPKESSSASSAVVEETKEQTKK